MRTRAVLVCVVLGAVGCAGNEATVVDVDSGVSVDVPFDRGVAMDTGDAGSALDGDVAIDDGGPIDERCGAELHNVCSGQCVDLSTSLLHCGGCDRPCMAPQNAMATCTAGTCGFVCNSSYSVCGSACVDLQTDDANCGACGQPCETGLTCVGGMCVCPSGGARCGSTCVDLQMDNNNCGECGRPCPMGQLCRDRMCGCTAPGLMTCGSACADTQTDVNHCGRCDNRCPIGRACRMGACVLDCPTGQTACGEACANLQTDNANCGMCGNACPTGQSCSAGVCVCPAGQRWTGRDCVTITTPRPVGPLTPFVVSTLRPTLRWDFGTGNDGARVEICSNRDCAGAPVQTFNATGSSGRVPTALMPRRPYWWRLYGRAGDATGTTPSVTWMFQTPARDLGTDTALTSTRRDINGDGYDDLEIGSNSNHVEVLFGSASGLHTDASDRLVFDNTETGFGASSALGDVNGDGLADLVVASRTNVFVYHGSATAPYLPSAPSATIPIAATAGSGGVSVAVGDINADGYDDIVAGTWDTRVIAVLGSRTGIDLSSTTPVGTGLSQPNRSAQAWFVPDIDGNGYSEMVISSPCHPLPDRCGDGTSGQAWLFVGTRTGLATTTITPSGLISGLPLNDARFGRRVDGNDWDGDGYGDFYVSSAHVGATLYRGRATRPPPQTSVISGPERNTVVSADFDLDGVADLALAGATTIGSTEFVEIFRAGTGMPTRRITGPDGGEFGNGLSAADHNGDGVPDLVVAADHAFSNRGRVYVYPGARDTGVATMASQVINPIGMNITLFGYIR